MKKIVSPILMAVLCAIWTCVGWLTALPYLGTMAFAAESPTAPAPSGYLPVTGPCGLEFPRDHGWHPGHRTEWWYYTGNLHTDTGELFGFQLTFFRHRISPPEAQSHWPQPPSPWRAQQLYFAHVALTDITAERFYQDELVARGAQGMAGVQAQDPGVRIFVRSWEAQIAEKEHLLRARAQDFDLRLDLQAEKEPVAHGLSGYSRKGSSPESASCYYSISRLAAKGVVTLKGKQFPVEGLTWMDHEYSSAPLEPNLVGWDWFSLQLSDQSELMLYQLRQHDGATHPASSGTYVDRSGETHHLQADAFRIEVQDYWTSPHTGARYPHRWLLKVPGQHMELVVEPRLDDQEMRTTQPTNITYWEGSVAVRGSTPLGPLTGVGYVELTGYASALPMF
jgi:predicted secreted hydrolase